MTVRPGQAAWRRAWAAGRRWLPGVSLPVGGHDGGRWIEPALHAPSTVRSELAAIPGFLPGVAVAALVALVGSRLVSETLAVSRRLAWALVFTFGITLAATLTPSREALQRGAGMAGTCDLSRLSMLPLDDLGRFTDSGLNVWLFVPLGCAIGLLPGSRRKLAIALAALVLPFAIESIQLAAPILGRACQSADVVDNLTGLVAGIVVGAVVGIAERQLARAGAPARPMQPD